MTIKAFKDRLDENLAQISAELRAGQYEFNKLRAHAINKPGSKKPRPLQIATVRDRVVMKAIAIFIEPAFQKFNLGCSFAFIKGRGVSSAVKQIRDLVEQGYKFYLEADIVDFFGSVDRQALWTMFSRQIRPKSLIPLIHQCFKLELQDLGSYATEYQQLFLGTDSGIPQGGVLSPMLANFYLYEFDRRMTKHGFNLIRYADDFVVMCKSEEQARQAYKFANDALTTLNLKTRSLDVPDSKSRIGNYSKDGLTFLGIRFEGKEVFPTNKAVKRFRDKVQEVLDSNSGLSLFKTLQRLTNLVNGWGKAYKGMRVAGLYIELDDFLKTSVVTYLENLGFHLTGKNKRKQMKLLGVPSLAAMVEHKKAAVAGTSS